MKRRVMLSLCGRQNYMGQEPDTIELITEGTLEPLGDGAWEICYSESDLTGMEGVTTTFHVAPSVVRLTRRGALRSEMVFQEGESNDSLYETQYGALLVSVCALKVAHDLSETGGTVDLRYGIEIEQSAVGWIEYHLDIRAAE